MEISQEVANAIGGVHTLMVTKSEEMKKYYGENFYAVGPYYAESASVGFEEKSPPQDVQQVFEELKKEKIICHYGRWLIPGKPKTFLVDFSKRFGQLKKIKERMQTDYGIDCFAMKKRKQDSTAGPRVSDTDSSLVWADAMIELVKRLLQLERFRGKPGILQFHFSDPSAALAADLRGVHQRVGLVATAHSTRLGREIVAHGGDLSQEIKHAKRVSKKREYQYPGRNITLHQFEILLARNVDVLTSVSDHLAPELHYILGRKPDMITPNGLNTSYFPPREKLNVLHERAKGKIHQFLKAYFSSLYPVDVRNSFLFFTSGRYELTTKGYELLLEALGRLNRRLRKRGSQETIFLLLMIITNGTRPDEEHSRKKRTMALERSKGKRSPICALSSLPHNDPLMKNITKNGLLNRTEDRVKVILCPPHIYPHGKLLSIMYEETISGMDVGIFPSLYEPWGYTPQETAAKGTLSITTDAAGFGTFVLQRSDQRTKPGIRVLKVEGRTREKIVTDLEKMMHWVINLSEPQKREKRRSAYELAKQTEWSMFSKCYIEAHNLAIKRACERTKSQQR